MLKVNLYCQLWLAIVVVILIVVNGAFVEAGKKKDKGLIIVLSNGGCGGNILVQTGDKDGKKGSGGHKIVVKSGDSGGGGCGCSSSCGSCGGGGGGGSGEHGAHEHVQHVPIPIAIPAGAPLPPPHEMHAAMMSQLRPVFSADASYPSSQPSEPSPSSDQDTQASNSSPSTSDNSGKSSSPSPSSSSSPKSSDKSDMVAPLFIPMNVITPPWFHGSPVFMDPSSQGHLSKSTNKGHSKSSSSSESNQGEKGEYTSSSDIAPTYNDPIFNLHGTNGQFLPSSPVGYQGYDPNNLHLLPGHHHQPADGNNNKKDNQQSTTNEKGNNKSQGNRNRYIQPIINSVQRLLRGPGPLREIEQNLVRHGQRMQASFSNLVPISISNYTSYLPSLPSLPSLPGLRSSSGNRDRKPSGVTSSSSSSTTTNDNRGYSRYLDSLRHRLRPLTVMEGSRLTSTLDNLWKSIRGRTSSSSSSSSSNQPSPSTANNQPEIIGNPGHQSIHHHQHTLSPNGHHQGHFNIPGQQNNQVMQQYLEQILTSKWWEWPSGGLLGPNLNQY